MPAPVLKERPPRPQDLINQLDDLMRQIRQTPLSTEQKQQMVQSLDRLRQQLMQGMQPPSMAVPRRTRQAPSRTETFVYHVHTGGQTYELTLDLPNPSLSSADSARVRDGLLDPPTLFRLFERNLLEAGTPYGDVRMEPADPAAAQAFNQRPARSRFDTMRDSFMADFRRDPGSVVVASL
jgi:hypothetical protein